MKQNKMYDQKDLSYFSSIRFDILKFLPESANKILEVGCGTGETLKLLKSKYKDSTTVGIELSVSAAEIAANNVDVVKNFDIEDYTNLLGLGDFDLILLLDVLEHLKDPWSLLDLLVGNNLSINGTVITSIPNARNYIFLTQLIRGKLEYKDCGVLDRTHLRFFTKESMFEMINNSGLQILECTATNLDGESRSAFLNRSTFGIFKDFLAVQYIIKAKKLTKSRE